MNQLVIKMHLIRLQLQEKLVETLKQELLAKTVIT